MVLLSALRTGDSVLDLRVHQTARQRTSLAHQGAAAVQPLEFDFHCHSLEFLLLKTPTRPHLYLTSCWKLFSVLSDLDLGLDSESLRGRKTMSERRSQPWKGQGRQPSAECRCSLRP